jgi:thiosulfate/3-mercaptopyruvate sulfurtransferase
MMKPDVSHHLIRVAAFALLTLTVATASLSAAGGTEQPLVRTAPDQILVTPEWVAEQGDAVVILDVGRSFEEFAAGHVPGAAFVQREVIATERNGVGSMLPEPDLVAADLAELGVSQGTPVVVYDAGRGTWSSRLFWALEYLGHEQVHLLDGGLTAWQETGISLSQEILVPQQGDFVAQVREQLLADQEYVESNLGNGEVLILDARSPAEYSGEDVRAARGGHVPGAINLDWVNNSNSDDPRFRPIEQLSQVYAQALQGHDGEVVTLCQAGFRAAHSYVALRILGYEEARMYDGSWSEWGNDPDAPIETDV